MTTKKSLKKEFLENRTSWKFFDRKEKDTDSLAPCVGLLCRISIEILKELQYMNDKKG
jgi:hypothetical protein